MRRTLILTLFLTGAVAAIAVGCSDVVSSNNGDVGATPSSNGAGNDAVVMSDSGAAVAARGVSPLCTTKTPTATTTTCLPDDDGTSMLSAFTKCEATTTLEDGGMLPRACRVVADAGASCSTTDGGANGNGVDGVACGTSTDCAPGFDCVLGTGNHLAVCRRYCCAGSSACDDHTSQNGGKTFCDIQSLAESSTLIPVCMPLKQCALVKPKECAPEETCAIVSDKGDTGCVTTGPQKETDPCEEAHCGDGLTCLGSVGDRQCYKLCRIDGNDSGVGSGCGTGQACTTGSLFPDTTYGVCR